MALMLALVACGLTPEPAADATTGQLLEWATEQAAEGALGEATIGYRRVLQRDSLEVTALLGLAQIYKLQERDGPADLYRRRAFHVHYAEGLAWAAKDVPDSALMALENAARVMPLHPLAHLRLGELKMAAGQTASAIENFERAVEANPRFAESLITLGQAYAASDRLTDATAAFERAIDANINALEAYLGLGRIFDGQQEWAAAADHFSKALLINPQSEPALRGLDRARAHL